jgi:hypothetical protein
MRAEVTMKFALGTICLIGLGLAAGCGDDAADTDAAPIDLFDATPPDAGVPDAFVCTQTECGTECVNTDTDPDHCGGCFMACTPAADCDAPDCLCPDNFVPGSPSFLMAQVSDTLAPPNLVGIGGFAGSDSGLHVLAVLFAPDATTGVDIDLTDTNAPVVGLGYELDTGTFTPRSGFVATAGTIHLTRACADGLAGTVTDATFAEADFTTLSPITDGCGFSGVTFAFDIGDSCDSTADAGPDDSGT